MESPFCPPDDPGFRLIETFGFHPGEGFRHLDLHLQRMQNAALSLGLAYDAQIARGALKGCEQNSPLRCRLTMDVSGQFEVTAAALGPSATQWRVAVSQSRLNSKDPWLQLKTTMRAFYDKARAELPDGVDENLFANERGELCEGTITNLFVTLPDGKQVTPPLSCGLLPGILRQEKLARGECVEQVVTLTDLHSARAISVGNSLRGEIAAELIG